VKIVKKDIFDSEKIENEKAINGGLNSDLEANKEIDLNDNEIDR